MYVETPAQQFPINPSLEYLLVSLVLQHIQKLCHPVTLNDVVVRLRGTVPHTRILSGLYNQHKKIQAPVHLPEQPVLLGDLLLVPLPPHPNSLRRFTDPIPLIDKRRDPRGSRYTTIEKIVNAERFSDL